MNVLRPHGNHIKLEQVLIVILLVLLVPVMLYIFRDERIDYNDFGDDDEPTLPIEMSYPAGDRPINAIGRQKSKEKEQLHHRLNEQMYQFLELRNVE